MARDTCGATRSIPGASSLVCDKATGHDGDHRGYLEQQDEVLFWPPAREAVTLAAVLGVGEPCDVLEALDVLIVGADALLEEYPGFQNVADARDAARLHVARLRALLSRTA